MSASDANVVIVGGGPAGLGAAARLSQRGITDVVVLDRERTLGGLPAQCGHRGFGVLRHRLPLTGVDFAARLAASASRARAALHTETTVLEVTPNREVVATSPAGVVHYRARAVILATGCREMPRPRRAEAGDRPAGVFNTAVVQRLVHDQGLLPGRDVVIVGSEDLGLMAVRLLARSGARVRAVVEEEPYLLGYKATYVYSVLPFRVPVLLGYRVSTVLGNHRVRGVEVERRLDGRREHIPCDAVIFSGRFVPESSVAREARIAIDARTGGPEVDQHFHTDTPGIFACGNVLHGAESADIALLEGERTGDAVAAFLGGELDSERSRRIRPDRWVQSVVPQRITSHRERTWLMIRPAIPLLVPRVQVALGDRIIASGVRPWAVPHRSLKMQVVVPSGMLHDRPADDVKVSLRGWARAWPSYSG